jgi:hypothetical protein
MLITGRLLSLIVPHWLLKVIESLPPCCCASSAVGYTNCADHVVRYFIQQAAKKGVDIFSVFDPLNWVDNMRVAMDFLSCCGRRRFLLDFFAVAVAVAVAVG